MGDHFLKEPYMTAANRWCCMRRLIRRQKTRKCMPVFTGIGVEIVMAPMAVSGVAVFKAIITARSGMANANADHPLR